MDTTFCSGVLGSERLCETFGPELWTGTLGW